MRALAALVVIASLASRVDAGTESAEPFDGGTLALQGVGGVVGGAVGAAALGAGLFGLFYITAEKGSWAAAIMGAFGVFLGGTAGVIVGVKLVGDHRDATGGWGGTALGFASGAAVTGLANGIDDGLKLHTPPGVKIGVAVGLLVAGSVVGYQLSNDGADPSAERRVMFSLPIVTF